MSGPRGQDGDKVAAQQPNWSFSRKRAGNILASLFLKLHQENDSNGKPLQTVCVKEGSPHGKSDVGLDICGFQSRLLLCL